MLFKKKTVDFSWLSFEELMDFVFCPSDFVVAFFYELLPYKAHAAERAGTGFLSAPVDQALVRVFFLVW